MLSEFGNLNEMNGNAFPIVYPLGVATGNNAISIRDADHLLHQWHLTPAKELSLLFYNQNIKNRHTAINQSRLQANRNESDYQSLTELLNNPQYLEEFNNLVSGPDATMSQQMQCDEVTSRISRYATPVGRSIPFHFSAQQDAISSIHAFVRAYGLPSVFHLYLVQFHLIILVLLL